MESTLPSPSESDLGEVDNSAICVGVGTKAKEIKPQSKYTDKDRYKIAKYANNHGPNQATRCFQTFFEKVQ